MSNEEKKAVLMKLLKGNSETTIKEFRKNNPKMSFPDWLFYSARNEANGKPRSRNNSMIFHKIPKEEKQRLIDELKANPEVTYSELKLAGKLTMSDGMFYMMRKKILGIKNGSKGNHVYTVIDEITFPKDHLESIKAVLEKVNLQSGTNILFSLAELANGITELRTTPKGRR